MRVRARRAGTNGLIVLRSLFLSLIFPLLLFPVALTFTEPWDDGDEQWVPWAVVGAGLYALAAIAWIRRRALATDSREALASSYRASFFIGVGLAESAALFGVCGVFVGGSLWIYLVGLAFALVGLRMIAPTRLDIEGRQREISAAGSPLSLLDALLTVPPAKR